ncbi:MAG: hypothetical protein QNJ17_16510 [Desulfocapsaceae bacterium]|nr:hypothetical protein [Desulfocapsaceae bacterium]
MSKVMRVVFVVLVITILSAETAQSSELPTREETLAEIKKDFGFVPNLLQEMSKSPAVPLV